MSTDIRVGVIGAGVMGSGIAQVMATAGYPTVCYDNSAEALKRAEERVTTGQFGLERGVQRGKLTQETAAGALGRLRFSSELEQAADADVVIEAVFEDLTVKGQVFRELDRLVPPHAILASNSSGFPVASLALATKRPELVVGWHWASPVPVQKLAEIVVTPATSQDTLETLRSMALACNKNPIVIKDAPFSWGFVTNRIYQAATLGALRIVGEGVATGEKVDQLLKDCFSWPAGPMQMYQKTTEGWS